MAPFGKLESIKAPDFLLDSQQAPAPCRPEARESGKKVYDLGVNCSSSSLDLQTSSCKPGEIAAIRVVAQEGIEGRDSFHPQQDRIEFRKIVDTLSIVGQTRIVRQDLFHPPQTRVEFKKVAGQQCRADMSYEPGKANADLFEALGIELKMEAKALAEARRRVGRPTDPHEEERLIAQFVAPVYNEAASKIRFSPLRQFRHLLVEANTKLKAGDYRGALANLKRAEEVAAEGNFQVSRSAESPFQKLFLTALRLLRQDLEKRYPNFKVLRPSEDKRDDSYRRWIESRPRQKIAGIFSAETCAACHQFELEQLESLVERHPEIHFFILENSSHASNEELGNSIRFKSSLLNAEIEFDPDFPKELHMASLGKLRGTEVSAQRYTLATPTIVVGTTDSRGKFTLLNGTEGVKVGTENIQPLVEALQKAELPLRSFRK